MSAEFRELRPAMSLLRSFATVSGFTAASRVLGFLRDILIANYLGSGPIADAFFVAFRFPNLFRRLFAEGAFSAAFVPVFAKRLEEEGREAARKLGEEVQAVLALGVFAFTALAIIFMPWLMPLIAPGFRDDPEQMQRAVELAQICFPYLFFMSLTAMLSGVLNSLYHFAAGAAAPVALNVCFIVSLLLIVPASEEPGEVLAWTVTVAGVVQVAIVVIACRYMGMSLRPSLPRLSPGVRRIFKLMGPGVLSAGVLQINILVGTMIASLQAGAVSWLYYADRVYQLPLGLIGIAIGVVLLPDLTRKLRGGDSEQALHSLNRGVEMALLLTLPATAALLVIPVPIAEVLFQRGAFTAADSQATAQALFAFALGLPAYVLVKVLQPAFYARENTVTPFHFAAIAVAANVVLSLALFYWIGFVGIALATAAAAWLQTLLLAVRLLRDGSARPDGALLRRLPRSLLASAVMAALLWGLHQWLQPWLAAGEGPALLALAILVGAGLAVFGLSALLFRAITLGEVRALLRRRRKPPA